MKPLYFPLIIFSALVLSACSKDFLKRYDNRIVGTWYISEVNRIGIGGNSSDVQFNEGSFEFNDDGSLLYIDQAGDTSTGYWNIRHRNINNSSVATLEMTAVNFTTQKVKGEFYDEMHFRSTNHFVAKINAPLRTFATHFRR
jgi:hypothetical protein